MPTRKKSPLNSGSLHERWMILKSRASTVKNATTGTSATTPGRFATITVPARSLRLPLELRQDRVRHGLQGVHVVHLEPLRHNPLYAGLGQSPEPLDDLALSAGE